MNLTTQREQAIALPRGGEQSVLATNKVIRNTYLLLSMTLAFSAVVAATSVALPFAGFTGLAYLCTAVACGGYWLHVAATRPATMDDRSWAKRVFLASLGCLLALCVLMAVDFR